MNIIKCNNCLNTIQADPQWQSVRCPYCNNVINLVPPQTPPGFQQPQFSHAPIFLQQQGPDILVTNGDYNTVFNLVAQTMMAHKVSIKRSDLNCGVISGNAPYGINLFGISVGCNFYGQNGITTIKFRAHFSDAFDTTGACSKKISEIIFGILANSYTIESQPVVSCAPAMSQNNMPSSQSSISLAVSSRLCGILGFFVPFAALIGLILGIIALTQTPANDSSTRNAAILGLVLSIIAMVVNSCFFMLVL